MVDLDEAFGEEDGDGEDGGMTDVEECRLLFDIAEEKVKENCNPEALREHLTTFVGVGSMEDSDCEIALEEGLQEDPDPREEREWVMCRAWELVDEEEMTLRSALDQAWEDAEAEQDEGGQ